MIPGVLSYGLGAYYTFDFLLAAFLFTGVIASGNLFGTDADALMKSVRELAGETEDADIIAKAKQSINMVKIVKSLNEVSSIMKERSSDNSKTSSLQSLSAYLALSKAEKDYGFDPSNYDISEAQALKLAAQFVRFDLNDDGVLELSEVEKLFQDLGLNLSTSEVEAAIEVLDQRKTGVVEFDEFAAWYTNRFPEPKTEQ